MTNILPGYDPVSLVPAVIVLHGDGTVSAWGSDGFRPEDSGVQQIVAGYDPVARIPAVTSGIPTARSRLGQRRLAPIDGNVTNILPGYDPVEPRARRDRAAWRWYGQRLGQRRLRPEDSGVQQIVAGYDPVARIPAVNVWHTDGTVSTWGSDGLHPSTAT